MVENCSQYNYFIFVKMCSSATILAHSPNKGFSVVIKEIGKVKPSHLLNKEFIFQRSWPYLPSNIRDRLAALQITRLSICSNFFLLESFRIQPIAAFLNHLTSRLYSLMNFMK
jgi:hypothetical protein